MSRNGVTHAREPGKEGRFTLRMHNDVFNAVNAAALNSGRGIGAEIAHRLLHSLDAEAQSPVLRAERVNRDEASEQRLEAVGRVIGAAFVAGVMAEAQDQERPLSTAIRDLGCFISGMAAMVRHAYALAPIEGETIVDLNERLIRHLPEF